MTSRRPLTEGIKSPSPPVDSQLEREFVYQSKNAPAPLPPIAAKNHSRVSISTRIRSDFAAALKRASLQRQLSGVEPNTLQDILEEAIEPWLKANGYMD